MVVYSSFQEVVEKEDWIIWSAIKHLRLYKNQEDFYQEGLIGLWEAYVRFNPMKGASFQTFAFHTVRGKMITLLKNAIKHETHQANLSEAMLELTVDEHSIIPFELELMWQHCDGLSDVQRRWVYKSFIEMKGPKQIAQEERVSLETVKSWRRYALKKIRENVLADL
ncbi:sigma-70 family RNA polymerase sigma factor [Bacillus salitolerans]|uniref:Sigma-70 family RNA polymerase sigma factor n=1 Tax=Bacillus salitolerans TaxID=1437434 RepID=A0ABW4LWI9_9BACI